MSYLRKLAVCAVVERGQDPEVVAKVLGVSRSSIYDWLKKHQEGGYDILETRDAPGAEPRITEEMDTWLKSIVISEKPENYGFDKLFWTCPLLAELMEQTHGVKVGASTIYTHLKDLDLSYQQPHYQAKEMDPEEVDFFLNDKFPRIQRLAIKMNADIGFEDEAGVDLSERSGRTWGLIGKQPNVIVTGQRGRINVLSAVTNQGEMDFEVTEQNINSETYIDFLSKLIGDRSRPLILLVDRVKFHHSRAVREFVRENRSRIRVYFLPKYAPDYNPAEQLWEEVKVNRIRRQPVKNRRDLKSRLKSTLKSVQCDLKRIRSFFMTPHTEYAAA